MIGPGGDLLRERGAGELEPETGARGKERELLGLVYLPAKAIGPHVAHPSAVEVLVPQLDLEPGAGPSAPLAHAVAPALHLARRRQCALPAAMIEVEDEPSAGAEHVGEPGEQPRGGVVIVVAEALPQREHGIAARRAEGQRRQVRREHAHGVRTRGQEGPRSGATAGARGAIPVEGDHVAVDGGGERKREPARPGARVEHDARRRGAEPAQQEGHLARGRDGVSRQEQVEPPRRVLIGLRREGHGRSMRRGCGPTPASAARAPHISSSTPPRASCGRGRPRRRRRATRARGGAPSTCPARTIASVTDQRA